MNSLISDLNEMLSPSEISIEEDVLKKHSKFMKNECVKMKGFGKARTIKSM